MRGILAKLMFFLLGICTYWCSAVHSLNSLAIVNLLLPSFKKEQHSFIKKNTAPEGSKSPVWRCILCVSNGITIIELIWKQCCSVSLGFKTASKSSVIAITFQYKKLFWPLPYTNLVMKQRKHHSGDLVFNIGVNPSYGNTSSVIISQWPV